MEVGEKRGRGEVEVGEKREREEVEVGEKRVRGLKDWKERGEKGWRSRDLVLYLLYLGGLLSWPLM